MKIKSIKKSGKRHTWDIEVENDHHYIMENGVVSHNTIANLVGSFPCIEPAFRHVYVKENLSGNFMVVNKYLVDKLIELNLWSESMCDKIRDNNGSLEGIDEIPESIKKVYKTAFEIHPKWYVKSSAARQQWIDQAISTNIFLSGTSGKLLHETYMNAWKSGLKTTYYLRSLGATQVDKTTAVSEPVSTPDEINDEFKNTDARIVQASMLKAMYDSEGDCEACQ